MKAFMNDCWQFIQQLDDAVGKVRVLNPIKSEEGWNTEHTVVNILCKNKPFIIDSIRGEMYQRGIIVHTMESTIYHVARSPSGALIKIVGDKLTSNNEEDSAQEEVFVHMEISHQSRKHDRLRLENTLNTILSDVSIVVGDFEPMSEKLAEVRASIDEGIFSPASDKKEAIAFLTWLGNRHFIFLGYAYATQSSNSQFLDYTIEAPSKLGLFKTTDVYCTIENTYLIDTARQGCDQELQDMAFFKSPHRSSVHRRVYPEYIVIKERDSQGIIIGEHYFIGLYTWEAYSTNPNDVPIIREKIKQILVRSALDKESHEGRSLARVLEVYPRDELFHGSVDEIYDSVLAINKIQERRQVRLFVRQSGLFVNCLVFVPNDIYRTEIINTIQQILVAAVGAEESDVSTFFQSHY